MTVVTVAFSELDSWLQNQPVNTAGTPYELNITELVEGNLESSNKQGTLGYILRKNNTKYVDLSNTILPASIEDMTDSFLNCTSLTTAPAIPNNVGNIAQCFCGCSSLTKAPEIPDSVDVMVESFGACTSLTEAPIIPNSVDNMYGCFENCTSLTAAPAIPASVYEMTECFYECTSLTTAPEIPDSVTNMRRCFCGCTSLITVPNIPASVINARECFQYDSSLTTWQQKDVLNSNIVYSHMFEGCTNLTNIYTNKQVSIKSFLNTLYTASTDNFPTNPDNLNFYTYDYPNPSVVPFSELNTFLQGVFDNTAQTPYKLDVTGLTVNDIDTSSRSGTLGNVIKTNSTKYVDLSETTLPNSITNMYNCFNGCTSLTTAPVIPNGVTNMGGCFRGCTSLITWKQSNTLDNVTNYLNAFKDCTNLINIYTNKQVSIKSFLNTLYTESTSNFPTDPDTLIFYTYDYPEASEVPFSELDTFLQGLVANTVQTPYELNVTGLTANNIKSSSSSGSLGNILRNNNTKYIDLSNTNLPVSVTSMSRCFYVCKSLTEAPVIPSSVTNMEHCFEGCTSLTEAPEIHGPVVSMANCFQGCTSLTEAPEIPNSVVNMTSCFDNCTLLTEAPVIPNSVVNMSNCFGDCALTVAPEIPDSVTNMEHCFKGCTSLTEAPVIPNSVTNMRYCFRECTSLTEAPVIPNSVTNMNSCFQDCTSLTEAPVIPNSVTNMSYCFETCTSLTEAPVIPNSVTNIVSCFSECTSLTTAPVIPNSVTDMHDCFSGCTSLEEITLFEADLESLVTNNKAQYAFLNCNSLTKIGVPSEPASESDWHAFRLKFGASTVEGKVYDQTGTAVTIPQTSITKSTLELPIKTDELWFPSGLTDNEIDAIIEKVIQFRYTYWNKEVLDPAEKNFVLWADDPDNVKTNLVPEIDYPIPVAKGGTGATTASGARTNLGAMGAKSANGFDGITDRAGADNVWIRTTSQGLIPYESGGIGNGHQNLGTSSWYFKNAYIDAIYAQALDATGNVLGSNLPFFGTVYSSNSYSDGYYEIARIESFASTVNHSVGMAGTVYSDQVGTIAISDFYVFVRGSGATASVFRFNETGRYSSVGLIATYEVFNTNQYRIRLYAPIRGNWHRFNTVINFASKGDVSERTSNKGVSFPNTRVTSVTGTSITKTATLTGNVSGSSSSCTGNAATATTAKHVPTAQPDSTNGAIWVV